ncbi:Transposon Tf2-8 polyprotein [Folsomia candida]|uniref:Transposon Tf2-8 polyprotein n=1 Tax=Folsomia candida TaxID=158441 RepID=A0A226DVL8_FOLCA|nr:Transposon Tf2-8 polyprotein [Folsomia candida]
MTQAQLDQIKLASDLDPAQITELKNLISEYADIFCWDSVNLSDLGRYNGPFEKDSDGVRLFVKDHSPIFQKHYNMSMFERKFLQKHMHKHNQEWGYYLPSVIFAINKAINESTKLSPYFLLMGRHPRLPGELGLSLPNFPDTYLDDLNRAREAVRNQLLLAQESSRASFEKRHKIQTFNPGDFVMLFYPNLHKDQSKKLSPQFRGPYRILEKKTDQNYRIAQLEPPFATDIVHLKRLRSISARYEHLSTYDPAQFQNQFLQESIPNSSKLKEVILQNNDQVTATTRSGRAIKLPKRFQNAGGS